MFCSHKAEYTKADPPSLHICLLGKSCSMARADMFSEGKKTNTFWLESHVLFFLFFFSCQFLLCAYPLVLI